MPLSRRDFLKTCAGLLAAPLLMTSCQKRSREIPIRRMGANVEHGHGLWQKKFSQPSRTLKTKVAIVGGGMAGLNSLWRLVGAELHDVLLLELDSEIGGNARWGSNQISNYPWGAHYLPVPDDSLPLVQRLCEELRLFERKDGILKPNRYSLCHDPESRLFIRGQWQEGLVPKSGVSDKDLEAYHRFFDAMDQFRQARGNDEKKAFAIPVDQSSQDPDFKKFDLLSMADFLSLQNYQSAYLSWYLDYCYRDDYGLTIEQTSAWAGIHYFAARPKDQEIFTWPEGNGWIVKQLKQKLQPFLKPHSLVWQIEENQNQVSLQCFDTAQNQSFQVIAEEVILATPQFITARIWRRPQNHEFKNIFHYTPWMIANLSLSEIPQGLGAAPAWDNVIYQSPSLGYVIATHQNLDSHPQQTVLTHYWPLCSNDPLETRKKALETRLEDWRDLIISDLKKPHPHIESSIQEIELWLWGHGMIGPKTNFIWNPTRLKAAQGSARIQLAHSDLSGISIFEEAQSQGVRAAEHILKNLNLLQQSWSA